jgi:inosine-uridine nucleoside N-ribohydrolase
VSEHELAHPSSASELAIPDPLCIAVAAWPHDIVTGSVRVRVGVELGGTHCRGLTWLDRKATGAAANVQLVTSCDMTRVHTELVASVSGTEGAGGLAAGGREAK